MLNALPVILVHTKYKYTGTYNNNMYTKNESQNAVFILLYTVYLCI